MIIYSISDNEQNRRIDNFLISTLKSPKSLIYRLIRKGAVRVNGRRIKPDYRLCLSDQVKVPEIYPDSAKQKPKKLSEKQQGDLISSILFEDTDFLIINKAPGLASQPGSGIAVSAIDAIRQIRPQHPDINLAHRLDRGTSGCLIFCKNKQMLIKINQMIAENKLRKQYIAVLKGRVEPNQITIDCPLKIISNAHHKKLNIPSPEGKHATTHFKVLRRSPSHTLVLARPITGRMHQIRAHAKHMGHPIAGDRLYDPSAELPAASTPRLYLHAYKITLPDPRQDGACLIQATSKIPQAFKCLINGSTC